MGTLALYATAFGDYGATLLDQRGGRAVTAALAGLVLLGFLGINLRGARVSGGVELGVVATRLLILAVFAVAGLTGIQTSITVAFWSLDVRGGRPLDALVAITTMR